MLILIVSSELSIRQQLFILQILEAVTVKKWHGFDIAVGDRIASAGHIRLQLSVLQDLDNFTVGNRLYRLDSSSNQDAPNTASSLVLILIITSFTTDRLLVENSLQVKQLVIMVSQSAFPVGLHLLLLQLLLQALQRVLVPRYS